MRRLWNTNTPWVGVRTTPAVYTQALSFGHVQRYQPALRVGPRTDTVKLLAQGLACIHPWIRAAAV